MELSGRFSGGAPGREPDLRRAGGLTARPRRDGVDRPRRPAGDLRSAPIPPVGREDHIRGAIDAPLLIEYADFECPFCAALSGRLAGLRLRRVFRHFPVRSSHPRAWAAACAAEAAARQGRFWEMHDSLFADQGRLEDPHLWDRARSLHLDLEQFEADRRSDSVLARIERDFRSGVRAGVVTTPTVFVAGVAYAGQLDEQLFEALSARPG